MSAKSRTNYPVKICLKECKNKDKKCDTCIKFSEYEEKDNA